MNARCCAGALALVLLAAASALAQQPSSIGRIKIASGEAFVVRQSSQLAAKVGDVLLEADAIRTGAGGHIGVTLRDDTRVSLGPNSEARLEKFLYSPSDGNVAFILRIVRGLTAYVSGRIAKLSPDAVRLETPMAIVGVRGTRVVIRVDTP